MRRFNVELHRHPGQAGVPGPAGAARRRGCGRAADPRRTRPACRGRRPGRSPVGARRPAPARPRRTRPRHPQRTVGVHPAWSGPLLGRAGHAERHPGALEARTTDFLIDALDNFVPFPDELARPVATALATGLADSGVSLPGLDLLPTEVATLDKALSALLRNDAALPLSLPIAALLNLLATQVNPAAVNGPFLSPFARLTYAEKARAFALLEGADSDLVALLDVHLPEPLKASVSGLLKFVGGALIEFATFGSYTEYAVYDPETGQLTGQPVGWQLTGYQPDGPVEGWDEFIGYYQGRTEVHD
ncbi:hypothetical protein ACFSVJ_05175 [Prauserella oleivorans]